MCVSVSMYVSVMCECVFVCECVIPVDRMKKMEIIFFAEIKWHFLCNDNF